MARRASSSRSAAWPRWPTTGGCCWSGCASRRPWWPPAPRNDRAARPRRRPRNPGLRRLRGAVEGDADRPRWSRRRSPPSVARLESRAVAGWTQNRAPIASAGVLVLALTALAVAAGALGGPAAAAAPAPEPVAPTETFVPGQTEPPSPVPGGESSPGPGGTAGPGESPGPADSSAPGDSGEPSFEPLPTPSP